MKNREFRELQVSSTQLAIIFFGILIIGVVIFLLGVSVGKKHAQASSKTAAALAQKAPEQVKDRLIVPEAKAAGTPQTTEAAKTAPEEKKAEPSARAAEAPPKVEARPPAAEEAKPTPDKAAAAKIGVPAETVKPAPVAEAPTPPRKGLYYVQVGALAEKKEAVALAQKYRSQGYPAVVVDPQPNDKRVYRVRIGGFESRQEADSALAKLASGSGRRVDYFVVRD